MSHNVEGNEMEFMEEVVDLEEDSAARKERRRRSRNRRSLVSRWNEQRPDVIDIESDDDVMELCIYIKDGGGTEKPAFCPVEIDSIHCSSSVAEGFNDDKIDKEPSDSDVIQSPSVFPSRLNVEEEDRLAADAFDIGSSKGCTIPGVGVMDVLSSDETLILQREPEVASEDEREWEGSLKSSSEQSSTKAFPVPFGQDPAPGNDQVEGHEKLELLVVHQNHQQQILCCVSQREETSSDDLPSPEPLLMQAEDVEVSNISEVSLSEPKTSSSYLKKNDGIDCGSNEITLNVSCENTPIERRSTRLKGVKKRDYASMVKTPRKSRVPPIPTLYHFDKGSQISGNEGEEKLGIPMPTLSPQLQQVYTEVIEKVASSAKCDQEHPQLHGPTKRVKKYVYTYTDLEKVRELCGEKIIVQYCKLCDTYYQSIAELRTHIETEHCVSASGVTSLNTATWDLEIARTFEDPQVILELELEEIKGQQQKKSSAP